MQTRNTSESCSATLSSLFFVVFQFVHCVSFLKHYDWGFYKYNEANFYFSQCKYLILHIVMAMYVSSFFHFFHSFIE